MSFIQAVLGVSKAPFLTLPVALVIAGASAAAYDGGASWLASGLALVGLVAVHAAVNAFNEASDMRTGIDLNTVPTPFSGGSGTLPSGAMTVTGANIVGIVGCAIGLAIGVYFVRQVGVWPLGAFILAGAISVVFYTDVFARSGLGEVFAGLGLGVLPVVGTALVQQGTIGRTAWAVGVPAFCMTFNLLLLNEFPDEKADRQGGRRNLVLMCGRPGAARIFVLMVLATPLSIVAAVAAGFLPLPALLGVLPTWFVVPAVRWALTVPDEPVPLPAMTGNVVWNHATNVCLAAGLVLAILLR